jgi:hypothetical protein
VNTTVIKIGSFNAGFRRQEFDEEAVVAALIRVIEDCAVPPDRVREVMTLFGIRMYEKHLAAQVARRQPVLFPYE